MVHKKGVQMNAVEKFVLYHPIGLIMRVFSLTEDGVERRVDMVMEMIKKALGIIIEDPRVEKRMDILEIEGQNVFKRVDILVPCDPRYPADCGLTAQALRKRIEENNWCANRVFVTEIKEGDLFCEVLNYGIAHQMEHGMHYSVIASPEVHSYMNKETMLAVLEYAAKGSLATGVAIDELTESVLAGRLANTFCMWRNKRLMQVGGFDLRAAKPLDEASADYKRGWDKDKGYVYYQMAGTEEMIPLAQMIKSHGEKQCIAAVRPQGPGVKLYQAPSAGPELDRHIAKMATKFIRQYTLLASAGFDSSYLTGALMD